MRPGRSTAFGMPSSALARVKPGGLSPSPSGRGSKIWQEEHSMQRSTSRILTTHTGSLPRSPELQELLRLREERRAFDPEAFAAGVRAAVHEVVQKQIAIGLDVINDGEQERSQYAAYVKERLTGFEGERIIRARPRLGDSDFPDFVATHQSSTSIPQPACTGPITWKNWQ